MKTSGNNLSDTSPNNSTEFPNNSEIFLGLSEDFWNSLDKSQQLEAFCAVIRRLYQGEIERNGTYRYVLYDIFGFGPEAYRKAQEAGFLALHNSIKTADYEEELLEEFCTNYLEVTPQEFRRAYRKYLEDNI